MAQKQKHLNELFDHGGFNSVWGFLKGHGPKRWQLGVEWVEDRIRHIRKRPRSDQSSVERWQKAEVVYKRHLAKERKKHKRSHGKSTQPKFHKRYLNGHPGHITGELERAIARAVVLHGACVTATTDGTHVTTSFHYPRNNGSHGYSDDLGHAADFGGTLDQYGGFYAAEKARGCENYDELFGPGDGYCDDCALHPGAAPDNPNHCHCAPKHTT